ncbi:hypothetical protein FPQ18DRAFT_419515 [Pyronema domesticum]|nr:hypothetical protein FPQ18DRAFT_419515 [Pyronema domesticum]
MASAPNEKLISTHYWECITSFQLLFDYLNKNGEVPEKLLGAVGQLRVWAENLAAHRRGSISLDYKLREASRFTLAMVSGKLKIPEHDGTEIEDDDEEDHDVQEDIPNQDNIDAATDEIRHSISSLFRLTIVTQNLSSRDRLERMEQIDVSAYESFVINHIREKYQLVEEGQYLVERLGKANTKRRQLLRYHEKHHEKLVGRLPEAMPRAYGQEPADETERAGGNTDLEGYVGDAHEYRQSDFMSEAVSSNMRTEVTTVYDDNFASPHNENETEYGYANSYSETGESQTSYASSAASSSDSNKLRVPPPPPDCYNIKPFECPYCFRIVSPPVIETLGRSHLFEKRHNWFHHEREMHRREWACSFCNGIFPSNQLFQNHITTQHPGAVHGSQMRVAVDQGERAIDCEQSCPLCRERLLIEKLQRRLGKHMEQIALFVVPGSVEEEEEEEEEGEDEDNEEEEGDKEEEDDQEDSNDEADEDNEEEGGDKDGEEDQKDANDEDEKGSKDSDKSSQKVSDDKSNPDPEAKQRPLVDQQAFFEAAKSGDMETVKLALLQNHLDINAVDHADKYYKKTALIYACMSGHEAIVKLLLDRKDIRVNLAEDDGWTPLMHACTEGKEGIVKLLLERDDIQVNLAAKDGRTPLMLACSNGKEVIVKLLLEREDIDIRLKDNEGKTAYDHCNWPISGDVKGRLNP